MKDNDRARTARRIHDVQKHLHRREEIKFAELEQKLARVEREQTELSQALSEDGALHGLFVDMTVRRIDKLKQEASRLAPELEARSRVLVQHAGRVRNAERLVSRLAGEMRRERERKELEEILEVSLARSHASLKQDR